MTTPDPSKPRPDVSHTVVMFVLALITILSILTLALLKTDVPPVFPQVLIGLTIGGAALAKAS